MSKTSQVVVKNVSKGPTMLSAQGYAKIQIDAGKTHTFEDGRIYEYYKASTQGLKTMGLVEIVAGGKADKVVATPALDEQEKLLNEAIAKSQMEAPTAPVEEVEEVEAKAAPATKAKPGKK